MFKNSLFTRIKLILQFLMGKGAYVLCCDQCGSIRLTKTKQNKMSNCASVQRMNSEFECLECGAKGTTKQSWEIQ